jgi:uracil phosphoribosyltransferase
VAALHVRDHALARVLVTRLRDHTTPAFEFRILVSALTSLVLAEALADISVTPTAVATPLQTTEGWRIAGALVFVPILRAGLGMAASAQAMVPDAAVWHVGIRRDEATLAPGVYYQNVPPTEASSVTAIVLDPMLATGGSAVAAVDLLKGAGVNSIRFVGLIGAPEGVHVLAAAHPDVPIHLAALDERLTGPGDRWPAGYILPGLGDAGDRQFGTT